MSNPRRRERYPGDYSPLRFRVVTSFLREVLEQHIAQFTIRVTRDGKRVEYKLEGVTNLGHILQIEVENITLNQIKVEIINRRRVREIEEMLELNPENYFFWGSPVDLRRYHTTYAADIIHTSELDAGETMKVSINYEGQVVPVTDNTDKREDYRMDIIEKEGKLRVVNKG